MNWLVQQLQAANNPQQAGTTPCPVQNKRLAAWPERAQRGRELHTKGAVEAYRKVMFGKGWMTSWQIECALGYARTSSTMFLKKLLVELKLIERRPKNGLPYNRKSGYEFRWIGE